MWISVHIFVTGSPANIQPNSETDHNVDNTSESTTIQKGNSLSDIPSFEMSEEDPEDEYGYMDRIEGISKGIYDEQKLLFSILLLS